MYEYECIKIWNELNNTKIVFIRNKQMLLY